MTNKLIIIVEKLYKNLEYQNLLMTYGRYHQNFYYFEIFYKMWLEIETSVSSVPSAPTTGL